MQACIILSFPPPLPVGGRNERVGKGKKNKGGKKRKKENWGKKAFDST